jgi:hypothetical protein
LPIIGIALALTIILLYYAINNILQTPKPQFGVNKFAIKEIYPTKQSGREWYIRMDNPKVDPIFHYSI